MSGNPSRVALPAARRRVTIGRDDRSGILLEHPGVSRTHAEITRLPNRVQIRDRGSTNGTFVNGNRIVGTHDLIDGDLIQVGPFRLRYQGGMLESSSLEGRFRLDAELLGRTVKVGPVWRRVQKVLLSDVNLSVGAGDFLALVGGSGAGKSTLIKALSGFAPANQGSVRVNGDRLYSSYEAYRNVLGYVPQDDILHVGLRVRSALRHTARLRMPDAPPSEIADRIRAVLDEVEMQDHADKRIVNLSGGQRKRVSIAAELLAEPGLFFLDEPTSGLDPGLDKKMMLTLRSLADRGRTVVLVTHATANILQCTHVAFLADGRLAFLGSPGEALTYFGEDDFADIYTRLAEGPRYQPGSRRNAERAKPPLSGSSIAQAWAAAFKNSALSERWREQAHPPLEPLDARSRLTTGRQSVSWMHQLSVLTGRMAELIRTDPGQLFSLLIVMPVIAIVLMVTTDYSDLVGPGTAEVTAEIQRQIQAASPGDPGASAPRQGIVQGAGNAQRTLFMMVLACSLLGLFAGAYEIVQERAIYVRERMVNLRILPYLGSKVLVLGLLAVLQCALFMAVLRARLDYPVDGVLIDARIEMLVTLVLATVASLSLGLLISSLVERGAVVVYPVLFALFVHMTFAGALFEIPSAATGISYATSSRWALEALGATTDLNGLRGQGGACLELGGQPATNAPLPDMVATPTPHEHCQPGQLAVAAPFDFLVRYDRDPSHLVSRWLALAGLAAGFLTLTGIQLRRQDAV